jgi:hypothetical protein
MLSFQTGCDAWNTSTYVARRLALWAAGTERRVEIMPLSITACSPVQVSPGDNQS